MGVAEIPSSEQTHIFKPRLRTGRVSSAHTPLAKASPMIKAKVKRWTFTPLLVK